MIDNEGPAAMPTSHPAPAIDHVVRKAADALFGQPLVTNVMRGQLVEAIVACALEHEWTWCAADYSSWDFERADGLRLEIKQAASRQTWTLDGAAPSRASFDIASRKGRWEGPEWIAEPGRAAQIYVLAHHAVPDRSADHRDAAQWDFYVVATSVLPDTMRISLAALKLLTRPCRFGELAAAVRDVADQVVLARGSAERR
jgi:hypothetical protein